MILWPVIGLALLLAWVARDEIAKHEAARWRRGQCPFAWHRPEGWLRCVKAQGHRGRHRCMQVHQQLRVIYGEKETA